MSNLFHRCFVKRPTGLMLRENSIQQSLIFTHIVEWRENRCFSWGPFLPHMACMWSSYQSNPVHLQSKHILQEQVPKKTGGTQNSREIINIINIATHSLSQIFCRSSRIIKTEVLCEGIGHRVFTPWCLWTAFSGKKKSVIYFSWCSISLDVTKEKQLSAKVERKSSISEYQVSMWDVFVCSSRASQILICSFLLVLLMHQGKK